MLQIAHDSSSTRRVRDTRVHVQARRIHGYRRVFRIAGEGPPLLLIHGIGDGSRTWEEIVPTLARHHLSSRRICSDTATRTNPALTIRSPHTPAGCVTC